jgi:hypothetical protein
MNMNEKKPQPVNKEAFRMLATEIGLNAAARRLGIPIPTAKSWAQRGGWKLPKRKGGGVPRSLPASASVLHPIADALDATHKELESATKTGLMQTLAKAAQQVSGKDALDISNTAQLRDICLAAARIFGWTGDSQVNVAVNNQMNVVCSEAERMKLIEQRERIMGARDIRQQPPQVLIHAPTPPIDAQTNGSTPIAENVGPLTLMQPLAPGEFDEPPTWEEETNN